MTTKPTNTLVATTLTDHSSETAERLAKLKRSPTKRGPAALRSRMLVAGAALGAGLAMIGGMTASAQATNSEASAAPASHVVRVVVDTGTSGGAAPALPVATQTPTTETPLDNQTAAPPPAAPVTESGGS